MDRKKTAQLQGNQSPCSLQEAFQLFHSVVFFCTCPGLLYSPKREIHQVKIRAVGWPIILGPNFLNICSAHSCVTFVVCAATPSCINVKLPFLNIILLNLFISISKISGLYYSALIFVPERTKTNFYCPNPDTPAHTIIEAAPKTLGTNFKSSGMS